MALIASRRQTLLYSGDFKLRPGLSAEACAPCPADTLVVETTFGQPRYRFPPVAAVARGLVEFCRDALAAGHTALLLGYSLGKSQDLLLALDQAGLPIMLHKQVFQMTRLHEQLGLRFPPYQEFDPATASGKVLIFPPSANRASLPASLGRIRPAVATGWAVEPGCRFRYGVDAAFPLSDHADFQELLELVALVSPKKVFTQHGFSADFAQTLRDRGYDSQALDEADQLHFNFSTPARRRPSLAPPA
jgi:Cft2 family RNA processing exonuclease